VPPGGPQLRLIHQSRTLLTLKAGMVISVMITLDIFQCHTARLASGRTRPQQPSSLGALMQNSRLYKLLEPRQTFDGLPGLHAAVTHLKSAITRMASTSEATYRGAKHTAGRNDTD
jgi:hypothetical protein